MATASKHDGANFLTVVHEGFASNIADMIEKLEGDSHGPQFTVQIADNR
jgi:hypothetical protein